MLPSISRAASATLGFVMFHLRTFAADFRATHRSYQVHGLSFGASLVMFLGFVLASPESKAVWQWLMFLPLFGFAAGFLIWCGPYIARVWAHPVGKAIVTVAHILVLVLATVFARSVVAASLLLPPQDFDLTVWFITIVSYIPAWSIAVSVLTGVVGTLLFIATYFLSLSTFLLRMAGIGARSFRDEKYFAQAVGAIAVCIFSIGIYDFATKNEQSLHQLVKWVAFFSDFQPAPLYPGIAEGERIRLHENGVISIAEIQNDEIQIRVRRYEEL
jgi:hypothetical protein